MFGTVVNRILDTLQVSINTRMELILTQPTYSFANVAALTTDAVLRIAVANKKIRVIAAYAVAGGVATSLVFNTKPGGAGLAISATLSNGVNSGEILGYNPAGWFETNVGHGLTVTTGAGSTTGVGVVTILVD